MLINFLDLRWLVGNTLFLALVHHLRLTFCYMEQEISLKLYCHKKILAYFVIFFLFLLCKQYLARGNVAEERTTAL
jgi:hypothetical protein